MIFIIIWFDIASEEIELNANPFNPFFMSEVIHVFAVALLL
jgi:hypothetical protein